MRTIKFRAWEHNLKEMISVDDIQFYRGDDIYVDGIKLKPKPRDEQPVMINTRLAWRIADGEDVTLMQFTGLFDKNGKEIYEGDIVKWHDNSENVDKGWSREAIVRINPDLYFECFRIGGKPHEHNFHFGNFIWTETDKYLEIIGHIYEK